METIALGIIDAQRGFMPAEEGERLGLPGFGELGVNNGERIVPKINALLGAFAVRNLPTFTTQDWHPVDTAHFADEPNFNTSWPVHCVAYTEGAKIHPGINLPENSTAFYKGREKLERGEDDTSYSGFNAIRFSDDLELPVWLERKQVTTVALGGLALDYCVKATALDLRQKMGLDVIVIADTTAPVAQETGLQAIDELEASGVQIATTDEILRKLTATAA